jgi:hypothetical protein
MATRASICVDRLRVIRDTIKTSWWGLILAEHDTEPTEMFGGLMKLLLAVLLLVPVDTFNRSSVYGLLSVLPEPVWGAVMLVFGGVHLLSLRHGNRHWRRWMALAGFLIWFSWSVSIFVGAPSSTGGVVYLLAALAQGWVYVRLGRPA